MTTVSRAFDTHALLADLAGQQRRVLGILDGLDDEALRRPVLPSGWSCAGMTRHLTLMTRFWFVEVMTGVRTDPPEDDEFHVPDDSPASTVLDAFAHETRAAAALVHDLPLDTPPAWWPDDTIGDGWRPDTLFDVLLHVLVETSCHTGHLDAARELIDGRTWDYARRRLTDPR